MLIDESCTFASSQRFCEFSRMSILDMSQQLSSKLVDDKEHCDFTWGNYGSEYSTMFSGYTEYSGISRTISEDSLEYHHHPIKNEETILQSRPKPIHFVSGTVQTITFDDEARPVVLTVGEQYYTTAQLLGKSSRHPPQSDVIKSEVTQATDTNELKCNLDFNFDKNVKKQDRVAVSVYRNKDNEKIATSFIHIQNLPDGEEEVESFRVVVPPQADEFTDKVGTLKTKIKHTVQYQ